MKIKTIIAIDPGRSGGISVFNNGELKAVKMPKDIQELNQYFLHLKSTYQDPVVFIEKVQAFSSDDDAPGKKFAINKMLANYTELLTMIKLNGFPFIEVYPISWQSTLGLKVKKDKRTKTERKNSYKQYAQYCFPEVKMNLAICDSVCVLKFALLKIKNDLPWISKRIVLPENKNLFK